MEQQVQDEWDRDVEETEISSEEESATSLAYEILNYPADTTLRGYLEQWDTNQLIVPNFQRKFVWDQVKASKLVESFLIGLPVPGVFLFKKREENGYLIIDGQQRITSVISYQKGLFNEKKFRLKGVAKKWEGKSFTDLDEADQFGIQNSVMRATIIQQLDPADSSSIYHIFERLNTGGVNLNAMEVRKCVSYGPFINHLEKINLNESWRSCLGGKPADKRLRDVELILRCLAIKSSLDTYEKPMKGYLNHFAEGMREKDTEFVPLCDAFICAVERIDKEVGEKPFHLRGRINYGLLDSLIVALMTFPKTEQIREKFENLKSDTNYSESATYNTSDTSVLKERIGLALAEFGA